jgi:Tfp pilus assembly protein PilN
MIASITRRLPSRWTGRALPQGRCADEDAVPDPGPDLVPDWYRRAIRQRRLLLAQGVVTALVLLAMAIVLVLLSDSEQAERSGLETLSQTQQETQQRLEALSASEERLQSLARRAQLAEQIGLPVQVSRVLSQTVRLLPETITLERLEVDTESPKSTADQVVKERELIFRLIGHAGEPRDVATLLSKLKAEPLLKNCRVVQGRETRTANNTTKMAFEIAFEIDLTLAGGSRDDRSLP